MSEKPTAEEFCKVSDTIWEQLGGRRFGAMTGVKVYFREAEVAEPSHFSFPELEVSSSKVSTMSGLC